MEQRIAPSVQIEAAIEAALAGGLADPDVLSTLGRLGAQLVLQRAVEDEMAAFLRRARYERTPDAAGSRAARACSGSRPPRVRSRSRCPRSATPSPASSPRSSPTRCWRSSNSLALAKPGADQAAAPAHRLYERFEVQTRAELAVLAVREGWLDLPVSTVAVVAGK